MTCDVWSQLTKSNCMKIAQEGIRSDDIIGECDALKSRHLPSEKQLVDTTIPDVKARCSKQRRGETARAGRQ